MLSALSLDMVIWLLFILPPACAALTSGVLCGLFFPATYPRDLLGLNLHSAQRYLGVDAASSTPQDENLFWEQVWVEGMTEK